MITLWVDCARALRRREPRESTANHDISGRGNIAAFTESGETSGTECGQVPSPWPT